MVKMVSFMLREYYIKRKKNRGSQLPQPAPLPWAQPSAPQASVLSSLLQATAHPPGAATPTRGTGGALGLR